MDQLIIFNLISFNFNWIDFNFNFNQFFNWCEGLEKLKGERLKRYKHPAEIVRQVGFASSKLLISHTISYYRTILHTLLQMCFFCKSVPGEARVTGHDPDLLMGNIAIESVTQLSFIRAKSAVHPTQQIRPKMFGFQQQTSQTTQTVSLNVFLCI